MTTSDVNQIGQVSIGSTFKPFIIAEVSANHGGNLQAALDLVDIAAQAGASAIKLQHYRPKQSLHAQTFPNLKLVVAHYGMGANYLICTQKQ